jgi:hypothetical protein
MSPKPQKPPTEAMIDEASRESFPASDPSAVAMPHRHPAQPANPAHGQPSSERRALSHIESLVEEERVLRAQKGELSVQDAARIKQVEVELDQCWDLLRQRRAARETGRDPSKAEPRPPDVVEGYTG